jgi:hypothetical protein
VKKVVDKEKTIYVAVGVQEETGFRTLTEEEKKEALNRNFALQNQSSDSSSTSSATTGSATATTNKIVSKQPVSTIPDIESDQE